jgi:hypothetical protein
MTLIMRCNMNEYCWRGQALAVAGFVPIFWASSLHGRKKLVALRCGPVAFVLVLFSSFD